MTKNKVAIIGAGAAGMLAAGKLCQLGYDVTLIEHMHKTGLKLGITGKGRCNLTNDCEPNEFIQSVVHNPRFLMSSINSFTPSDTKELFESLGVPLKTERGNRVFPVSDKSLDIVYALRKYCSKSNLINKKASTLLVKDNTVEGVKCTDGTIIKADYVIMATGGKSYVQTGSDGSGFDIARAVGHTITEFQPSLVPIECAENYCKELQGLSLKNVSLKLYQGDKQVYEDFGEMIFTHFGISGPMVLSMSGHMDAHKEYKMYIGLKPALDDKKLKERILSDFNKYNNRNFENSLSDLLPQKLIPVIVRLSGIDKFKKVNSITKEERERVFELLRRLPLTFKGFRPINEAIVTRGGINVKEINPKTMESKIINGLFFAGEMIDVDAYTGGFNLQIAFSTAMAATNGIVEK